MEVGAEMCVCVCVCVCVFRGRCGERGKDVFIQQSFYLFDFLFFFIRENNRRIPPHSQRPPKIISVIAF